MGVERRQIVQQIERFNLKSFPAVVTGVGEPDENDIKRVGFREVSFNYGLDFPPDNYETGLQVVPGALSFDETHPFAAVDLTDRDIDEGEVVWINESFHAATGLPVYYITDGQEPEFCIDELPAPAANTVHVEADPENFDHRFVMPGCMYFTPDDKLAPFVTIDPDKMFVMDDEPAGEDISGSTVWATGDMALDGEGKLRPRLGLNVCLDDPVTPDPGEVQVEVKGTVQDGQLCWWANVPEGNGNGNGDTTWTVLQRTTTGTVTIPADALDVIVHAVGGGGGGANGLAQENVGPDDIPFTGSAGGGGGSGGVVELRLAAVPLRGTEIRFELGDGGAGSEDGGSDPQNGDDTLVQVPDNGGWVTIATAGGGFAGSADASSGHGSGGFPGRGDLSMGAVDGDGIGLVGQFGQDGQSAMPTSMRWGSRTRGGRGGTPPYTARFDVSSLGHGTGGDGGAGTDTSTGGPGGHGVRGWGAVWVRIPR